MAQLEQALLYALRSTTTPLADKVQRAADALDAAPDSAALPTLVRDWALDILLKSTRIPSLAPALSDAALWAVIARTTAACSPLTIVTPTLAVLIAFVGLYSEGGASAETLRSVAATWARIAPSAMRKATVDGGLESYDKLVAASLSFHAPAAGRTPEEVADWAVLGASWLAALRTVVLDAGKGGKKVSSRDSAAAKALISEVGSLTPYLYRSRAIRCRSCRTSCHSCPYWRILRLSEPPCYKPCRLRSSTSTICAEVWLVSRIRLEQPRLARRPSRLSTPSSSPLSRRCRRKPLPRREQRSLP